MIPSNLTDRMQLIRDFDSLILRHMVIEMGVQTLCRPAGAASEILTMFEESFRQDRTAYIEEIQPVNGAILPEAGLPKPRSAKSKSNALRYKRAAEAIAKDPWHTADWRKEVFRFAAEHHGVFSLPGYGGYYASHHKKKIGHTRLRSTLSDMKDRQHFLERLANGNYVVTEAGKKAALELGIDFGKIPITSKKLVPAKKAGTHTRPPSQGPANSEMLKKYAAKHNGNIFATDFMKTYKTSAGSTYAQLSRMQSDQLVEKVKPGHFRLVEKGVAASPSK